MPAIDTGALRKLQQDIGGEPEVMRELMDTFLGEAPQCVVAMQEALKTSDRRELNRAVHSLKSTSATFGAARLSRLCRDLESESERAVPPDAAAQVEAIAEEWALVERELRAWAPG